MIKKTSAFLLLLLLCFNFAGCQPGFLSQRKIMSLEKNPVATIALSYEKDGYTKTIELEYELEYAKAPNTVTNFINLSEEKFYDNKVFDYASVDAYSATSLQYIVGGRYFINEDDKYELEKKNYNIVGEFEANGWEANDLDQIFGSLVMFRESGATKFNTASTAFYLSFSDNNSRNGNYAVISNTVSSSGKIVEVGNEDNFVEYEKQDGLLHWFASDMRELTTTSKTTSEDKPIHNLPVYTITITSVTVNTFGVKFPTAKRIRA